MGWGGEQEQAATHSYCASHNLGPRCASLPSEIYIYFLSSLQQVAVKSLEDPEALSHLHTSLTGLLGS